VSASEKSRSQPASLLSDAAVKQDALPFPAPPSGSIAGRTIQESVYSPKPATKHLPDDAPNILIVLIDDARPGLPSTFWGEVTTKTLGRIVADGITYSRLHTTACVPPPELRC